MSPAEVLNAFGAWLVPTLARLSLELAILAAVVAAALFAFRVRSPRLRHAFWGLVLAKPVATFLVASPLSLYWFLQPAAPAPTAGPMGLAVSFEGWRHPMPAPVELEVASPPSAPPPAPHLASWQRLDRYGLAATAWLAVASLLALRLACGAAFVHRLRRRAVPQLAGPLAEAAHAAAGDLGLRRPLPVSLSSQVRSPVLTGAIHPQVLLPPSLVQELDPDQLRLILAHESAHARRRDNLVLVVQRLAEVLLFFHPAVWWCGWAMGREAEAACDEAVLQAHAGRRAEYAQGLVEVAALAGSGERPATDGLLMTTFAARETGFSRRVQRVLDGRRVTPAGLATAALLAFAAVAVAGLPRAAERRPNDTDEDTGGAAMAGRDDRSGSAPTRVVRREGGKVWIEGLEGVDWGGSFFGREDSQVRCLVEALRGAGLDVSYAEAMGLSGAAFKLTIAPDLFVAEIHSEMGMDWPEIVSRVWGVVYEPDALSLSDEKNPGWRDGLLALARESIGRGIPLFYMNGEWNLLVGYREDGGAFLTMPYAGSKSGYVESAEPGGFLGEAWFASVLRPAGEAAPRREALVRSLHSALELASRPAEGEGKRLFGTAAYEAWVAAIGDPPERVSLHGNAFSYSQLLTSRKAAAQYLCATAEELAGEAAPHLRAAADRYDRIGQRLWNGRACVAHPWEESWTPANRAIEADILEACLADEREAVARIEAALAVLGEPVGAGAGQGAVAPSSGPGGRHLLEGLEYPQRIAAELACIEGALRFLGMEMSPAWLYGGSGHAFAITMAPEVHIASPYAWQKTVYDLAPNLGFRLTGIKVAKREAGEAYPARQRAAWELVRHAIDRGLPCYADRVCRVPDYALVTGYDEVGYYYTHPAVTGGPTPWQQLGTEDIEVLDVWRVEPREARPDEEIVRAALDTVLKRAATPTGWAMASWEGQVSGPAAFDLWASEVESGRALRDAHGYNAMFWCEYREMAAAFLEEARARLPGRCDAAFDAAAARYRIVAERLAQVRDLDPYVPAKSDWVTKLRSPEAARLLREAAAAERQGLVALAGVLAALGGTPPGTYLDGSFLQSRGSPGTGSDGSGAGEARPAETTPAPPDQVEHRSLGADAAPQGSVSAPPGRRVLEGVPRMASHTDRWRFTHFCHALDVSLQYLGEPEQYDRLMALSGAGLRMAWAPQMWDGGNSDPLGMARQTLEPMRRALWGAGYRMVPVARVQADGWPQDILQAETRRLSGELTDEAGFRRRILESIDRGRPVIAFGVIGPPEACVIT
ncbi:MAG: M56 family metallopeptidase, partial [Gemmatimonadota bacterium]